MSFKNLFIPHDRTPEEEAWVEEEIEEQEARFLAIEQQMNDLATERETWYAEFFDRISTIGFNMDGDDKIRIPRDQLPLKPDDREDKVIWKYGVDE